MTWLGVSVSFSTLKLLSSPYFLLWKEVTACSPHLGSGELYSAPTGWSIYMDHLEFFRTDLSLLPYLFNHAFVYISGDSWMFILNFEESRSNYHMIFLLNFTRTLSHVWIHPAPSCMSLAPVLESAISPLSLGSFCWRIVLKTKIWVLHVLVVTGVSLLLSPLSLQRDMCMCSNPCV